MRLAFSANAQLLATASNDRTARQLKLPFAKYKGSGVTCVGKLRNACTDQAIWLITFDVHLIGAEM